MEGLIYETATIMDAFPREQQGAGLVNAGAAVASVIKNRL